jgi:hypothetical protein
VIGFGAVAPPLEVVVAAACAVVVVEVGSVRSMPLGAAPQEQSVAVIRSALVTVHIKPYLYK